MATKHSKQFSAIDPTLLDLAMFYACLWDHFRHAVEQWPRDEVFVFDEDQSLKAIQFHRQRIRENPDTGRTLAIIVDRDFDHCIEWSKSLKTKNGSQLEENRALRAAAVENFGDYLMEQSHRYAELSRSPRPG